MPISSLQISHLRNIISTNITCSPHFNLFFGDNAAGKTSLLEAIYYLGTGKSFRSNHHNHVIHSNENAFTIFAELTSDSVVLPIGVQRSRDGAMQIRINEENVKSIAEISQQLPIQLISSDSHRILSDGPKVRRQFLDWGLFHTNSLFFSQWKTFQKLLVQRNAALKARAPHDELLIWNHAFSVAGEALTTMRRAYLIEFLPFFNDIMGVLLNGVSITANYLQGWDEQYPLEGCLNKHVSRETIVGHSLFGPQRADLYLSANELPAHDALSQGQQKLVSYALRLAQGLHLQSITNKIPVYLIDDLPSELDAEKRALVTAILSGVNAQVFITGIESSDLEPILALCGENRMFHVKHGVVLRGMMEQ